MRKGAALGWNRSTREQLARLNLLICLGLISACTGAGPTFEAAVYPPLPSTAGVFVFKEESEINQPFEVVGGIYYDNPKPLQILGPDDALEPLKAEARAIGANGLILNFAEPVQSGIVSRGIYAEALAIRLTSKTP